MLITEREAIYVSKWGSHHEKFEHALSTVERRDLTEAQKTTDFVQLNEHLKELLTRENTPQISVAVLMMLPAFSHINSLTECFQRLMGDVNTSRAAIESTNISNSSICNESNSNRIVFLTIRNRSNRITCYSYEFE